MAKFKVPMDISGEVGKEWAYTFGRNTNWVQHTTGWDLSRIPRSQTQTNCLETASNPIEKWYWGARDDMGKMDGKEEENGKSMDYFRIS